jgi:hypothetical protein
MDPLGEVAEINVCLANPSSDDRSSDEELASAQNKKLQHKA